MTIGLVFVFILVGASIFVNGWTDAPNAIATVVSTRVLRPRISVVLASIMNFLGVWLMGTAVANTIGSIIRLSPGNEALVTLGAAQLSIVIWSVTAWRFGIPTSESHALIAGLTGAGIASVGIGQVSGEAWTKVLQGLLISSVIGLMAGFAVAKAVVFLFRNTSRAKSNIFFSYAQVISAAAMAFSHGAQDGQKFMGVLAAALIYSGFTSNTINNGITIPVWVMFLCSIIMSAGTSIGGYRIIKKMGMDMVKLEKYQGFAADAAASICLLISTVFGLPASTTHTKNAAIMGVGLAKRFSSVNWLVVKDMVAAWILTFPICGLIAYMVAKLFLLIF
ncbi:MAG: inorganic phosphate transporter [Firmicutes bacterium]|nr:inorganic phosphate transporter [Bacillota bacterium]